MKSNGQTFKFTEALKRDLRLEKEQRAQCETVLVEMVCRMHRRVLALEEALEPFSRMPAYDTPRAVWLEKARRAASDHDVYAQALRELNAKVKVVGITVLTERN